MKSWMLFSMLIPLVMSTGCAANAARLVARTGSADSGIVVQGEGEAQAAPDLAVLRVGVEAHRPTMAEAREASASAQTRILDAVRALGVAAADVQTEQLTLAPDYEYGEAGRRLRGYVATNVVSVRIRDVARAGEIVDATVGAAGDDARVDGVAFEIEDGTALRAEARRRAVADARAKAEQLAAELGGRVGDPIFVEETAVNPPGPMMMRLAADASTPIAAGELTMNVSVRVRWTLSR